MDTELSRIAQILLYFRAHCAESGGLSIVRASLMVYLADWKSAIDRSKQITNLNWEVKPGSGLQSRHPSHSKFDAAIEGNVDDYILSYLRHKSARDFWKMMEKLSRSEGLLSKDECKVLEEIVDVTKPLSWPEFIRLVYSTFPILSQARDEPPASDEPHTLNLVESAGTYKRLLQTS